jgi:hypothetical protein
MVGEGIAILVEVLGQSVLAESTRGLVEKRTRGPVFTLVELYGVRRTQRRLTRYRAIPKRKVSSRRARHPRRWRLDSDFFNGAQFIVT